MTQKTRGNGLQNTCYILLILFMIFGGLSCVSSELTSSSTEPLSLPPTIAKAEKGIDATSIAFADQITNSSSSVSSGFLLFTQPEYNDSTVIGKLTGNALEDTKATIVIYVNQTYYKSINMTDGTFELEVTGALIDKLIELSILISGNISTLKQPSSLSADTDNNNAQTKALLASNDTIIVSPPLGVKVSYDSYTGAFVENTFITNVSSDASDESFQHVIRGEPIAISYADEVAYLATNASGTIIAKVNYQELVPTVVYNDLKSLLMELVFDSSGNLYGTDKGSGLIKKIDTSGNLTTLGDSTGVPIVIGYDVGTGAPTEYRQIVLSPNETFLATTAYTKNSNNEDVFTVGFIDISEDSATYGEQVSIVPLPDSETEGADYINFAWTSSTHLVINKVFETGTDESSYVKEYDVTSLLDNNTSNDSLVDGKFSITNDYAWFRGAWSDPNTGNTVYVCENDNLCGYNRDTGALGTNGLLINAEDEGWVYISDCDFAYDGSYVICTFNIEEDGSGGNKNNTSQRPGGTVLYNFADKSYTEYPTLIGVYPAASKKTTDWFAFIEVIDVYGTVQIGFEQVGEQ